MEMTIRMPDRYNVMSEEEMTYTNGGAAADVIAVTSTIVSTVAGIYAIYSTIWGITGAGIYAIYSTIWGITGARNWVAANKGGDLMTTAEKAINEGVTFATSSVGNLIQSCVALMGMTAVWPITAIALITA